MKFFLICFISLFLTSYCLSQETSKNPPNPIIECKVNYVDNVNKSSNDDGIEIGKFIPQFGGEGTYTEKKFRVGKLKMFVFASVLYEDD